MRSRSNIYLLGMMGVGKSTVGPLLAEMLGRAFVDLDVLIEEDSGQTIVRLFAEESEKGFRRLERQVLREVAAREDLVVALGGGSVLSAENRRLIHDTGIAIYLEASLPTLVARNRGQERPLLKNHTESGLHQRLRQLLSERRPLYENLCDITVNADFESPPRLAQAIAEKLKELRDRSQG